MTVYYTQKIIRRLVGSILVLTLTAFISSINANSLSDKVNNVYTNEMMHCTEKDCFFPEKTLITEDIIVKGQINWNHNKNLVLHTKGNIIFKEQGMIVVSGDSSVILKSGMEPNQDTDNPTIKFEKNTPQIQVLGKGIVELHYNPDKGNKKYKYHNPKDFSTHIMGHEISYMLVNNVDDLQYITARPSGNFALSKDIDAAETKEWDDGYGFYPIGNKSYPFSGNFDGNGYTIFNLFINRKNIDDVGLFGVVKGVSLLSGNIAASIKNLTIKNSDIFGADRVGACIGTATIVDISDVLIKDTFVSGEEVVGGVIGSIALPISINNITYSKDVNKNKLNYTIGACAGYNCNCKNTTNARYCWNDYNKYKLEEFIALLDSNTDFSYINSVEMNVENRNCIFTINNQDNKFFIKMNVSECPNSEELKGCINNMMIALCNAITGGEK